PGQRKVIAQLRAGEPVDPVHGQRAKQRSVHNTYFTLPVLVAMLSNHYGFLYGAPNNWMVLVELMVAGALIRHSFVARHKALVQGKPVPWRYAVIGTVMILALAVWLMPPPQPKVEASAPVTYAELRQVLDTRCVMCHNDELASKNVNLTKAETLTAQAQMINQQAVILKTMPLNNATQITDAERALIGRWFKEGAPVK
ncbi:MAG: urate hydroxylase PuuD, partial [Burkholderiaceae bacterium]|nr:urate hydroxylase PuuD [Burkholderiaceae bacterium]